MSLPFLKGVTEACCDTIGGGIACGESDATYTIRLRPERSFYWDSFHLTHVGSRKIAKMLVEGDGYTCPGPNINAVRKNPKCGLSNNIIL